MEQLFLPHKCDSQKAISQKAHYFKQAGMVEPKHWSHQEPGELKVACLGTWFEIGASSHVLLLKKGYLLALSCIITVYTCSS